MWAWLGAAAVGLSLGLLGSGGAILTVPILVYLVGHDEKSAIVESLAIVGAIALTGAVRAALARRLDLRSTLVLALPGMVGASIGARAAVFVPGAVQLLLLATLMLVASVRMARSGPAAPGDQPPSEPRPPAGPVPAARESLGRGIAWGVGLGVATGLVGVGGGFLIVPVLVLVRRLPMAVAVGTSLAIIAVNSTTGFLHSLVPIGSSAAPVTIDWSIVGVFTALGIAGSLVGSSLAGRINDRLLKRLFAGFLVAMAIYIVIRQAPRVFPGLLGAPPASTAAEPA